MDDEFPFADMHPTAGYLFAEELDAHYLALDDFRSTLLQDDAKPVGPFSFISPVAPGSPSSVVYLPPYYLSTGLDDGLFDDDNVFIKPEPMLEVPTTTPAPKLVVRDDCMDADRERLRRRQRGYEKRYRGRKRVSTQSA
ncbi:unnamed protein product [Phytophthora lilii]|uniref:Unnamed protein product n=1 Tax=Phytophthora lilii TaxID=2077276 RepID=A0A9W6WT54_9STRA|nr:unnamed protein product [Phytophthora lilii]